MKSLKKLILKSIQFLYRKTASKSDLAFELGDTSDPLFGYMSGMPVDRVLISGAFERLKDVAYLNLQGKNGLEVGGTEYLTTYFKNIKKNRLSFLEHQPIGNHDQFGISGDLTAPNCEVSNYYDVVISTQVLVYVQDDVQAIKTFKQMMQPSGLLIGSEPFLAPLSIYDDSRWGENRRYSPRSLRAILEQEFEIIDFQVLGNAVTSAAIILGLPVDSLNRELLSRNRHSHGTCMFYVAKKVV